MIKLIGRARKPKASGKGIKGKQKSNIKPGFSAFENQLNILKK
jgi:hypothetical protein